MIGVIFISINSQTGKCYVGKSTRIEKVRRGLYIGSGGRQFSNVKKKYGKKAFTVYIIEEVNGDLKELNRAEIKWITFYRNHFGNEQLYNQTEGGDGVSSEYMIARHRDLDYRNRTVTRMLTTWKCPERRKRHSLRVAEQNTKNYKLQAPDGTIYRFRNLKEFCEKHDLNYFSMRWISQGRIFTKGAYIGWINLAIAPSDE